eukprot:7610388-Pyramimonas_sp.AAC.1
MRRWRFPARARLSTSAGTAQIGGDTFEWVGGDGKVSISTSRKGRSRSSACAGPPAPARAAASAWPPSATIWCPSAP